MSHPSLIAYQDGHTWSFSLDAAQSPSYLLLTVRGHPCLERMERMREALRGYRKRVQLDTGQFCPIIIDRRQDRVPAPAVLQAWRALLEQVQQQLTCLITIVDPSRPDRLLMEISMEILGQFITPYCVTVYSWEEALEQVNLFHTRREIARSREMACPLGEEL